MTAEKLFHVAPHQLLHLYSLLLSMLLSAVQGRKIELPHFPADGHFCMPCVKILTLPSVLFTAALDNYVRAFIVHIPLEEKPFC